MSTSSWRLEATLGGWKILKLVPYYRHRSLYDNIDSLLDVRLSVLQMSFKFDTVMSIKSTGFMLIRRYDNKANESVIPHVEVASGILAVGIERRRDASAAEGRREGCGRNTGIRDNPLDVTLKFRRVNVLRKRRIGIAGKYLLGLTILGGTASQDTFRDASSSLAEPLTRELGKSTIINNRMACSSSSPSTLVDSTSYNTIPDEGSITGTIRKACQKPLPFGWIMDVTLAGELKVYAQYEITRDESINSSVETKKGNVRVLC
ncbi:hypothetical protein CPC08DRAFT_727508 [Agrocybe pediades]|nr:hypothetical protein CPC08DRAFT_727508 [Agrocybe pediades]